VGSGSDPSLYICSINRSIGRRFREHAMSRRGLAAWKGSRA
jgi:hypothetical protein